MQRSGGEFAAIFAHSPLYANSPAVDIHRPNRRWTTGRTIKGDQWTRCDALRPDSRAPLLFSKSIQANVRQDRVIPPIRNAHVDVLVPFAASILFPSYDASRTVINNFYYWRIASLYVSSLLESLQLSLIRHVHTTFPHPKIATFFYANKNLQHCARHSSERSKETAEIRR